MPAHPQPGPEGVRLAQMLAPLSMVTDLARAHPPEEAMRAAGRLGLGAEGQLGLGQMFERWDGRGGPKGLRGEEIAAPARVAAVAYTAVMFHDVGGAEGAAAAVRRWSGRILDPAIADAF